MEQSHILLVHHRRIGAWLPPGGHIEDCELPHETAIRETKEETGIDIAPLNLFPTPVTENEEAFFLPSPLCIHAVKAREKDLDYYHIDLAFLCLPLMDKDNPNVLPEIVASEEVYDVRWVPLHTLSQIPLAKNVLEIVALAKSRLNS